LNRINKLRQALKSTGITDATLNDQNFDIINFFENQCVQQSIRLNYVPLIDPSKQNHGEVLIESFRLISEGPHTLHPKCKAVSYKRALEVLLGKSELAVRTAAAQKRSPGLKLDVENLSLNTNTNVNFEHELYRTDCDENVVSSSSSINKTEQGTTAVVDLNAMLKSMIFKESSQNTQNNSVVSRNSASNALLNSLLINEDSKDDQDEDDDEEDKTQSVDKKARYYLIEYNSLIKLEHG
jgi:hypothetical protein